MPQDPLRTLLLRAAAEALLAVGEGEPTEVPPPVVVSDGLWRVEVVVSRVAADPGAAGRRVAAGPHLTGLDEDILAAATDRPQRMGELARAADHDTDSYFRQRVRGLVRKGLLVREGEGYRLP